VALKVSRGDLAHQLRHKVESFLPWAERRRIALSLAAPAAPVELYFDPRELEKVFDNLLANALKFTPEGGRVEVSLATRPGKDAVEVNVRDDGPGIPLAELERVFDRFHQVDGEERRRFGGSGIGLALARQLVELHRGMISVTSTEGRGSCFTVTLLTGSDHFPAEWIVTESAPVPEPAPEGATALLPPTGDGITAARAVHDADVANGNHGNGLEQDRTTVLVIDDNVEIRAYIRRHLEPAYRVLEAADGDEGLASARRFVPDVVVSDVMMPGLDGNALFRALRQDPELELVPVVLLTAKASAEARLDGLREGVDEYLVKPFDPRELKARLDNLLAGRKRLLAKAEALPRPLRVSEIEATPADQAFLARVQSLVEERLGDSELTVEGLASALNCERSYLLRKLRALTGEAPSELIRSFRLQRAEQLLKARAGAVSEIAYTVGFKSVAHFSNAFQARYGERPSVFAARHRPG
jgi:DNA-binding response OmpR family regulator